MPENSKNKVKYTYIWVSFVILVFGIIFVPKIVDRIKNNTTVKNNRSTAITSPDKLSYIINNGEKRKVPDFRFLNQDSIYVSNKDYLGKVYVVDFFFTTCPTICPIMTRNLVSLQNEFKETSDFGIASFTINPRYDTPKVLRNYKETYSIIDKDWHLLTGDQGAIYNLAQNGFYIIANEVEDAPGGFEHSGLFALVDKEGYLRSRIDDFGNPLIYYRGTVTEAQGKNAEGEPEQISILREDIKKLLAE